MYSRKSIVPFRIDLHYVLCIRRVENAFYGVLTYTNVVKQTRPCESSVDIVFRFKYI